MYKEIIIKLKEIDQLVEYGFLEEAHKEILALIKLCQTNKS